MKIAYFTDTYSPEVNGVTMTLARLGGYLEDRGIRHIVFAPDYKSEEQGALVAPSDLRDVHRFPGFKVAVSPNSRLAFPIPIRMFQLCDEFAPDVVHVTTEFGIGHSGLLYASLRKLPLVMSYHTDYCKYLEYHRLMALWPIAELFFKVYYSNADRTLVPSDYTMEQLRRKGYENLGVWSRGIDTSKFNPAFRSGRTRDSLGIGDRCAFLYVGRLSAEKGLHTLLDAIKTINGLFPGKAVFIFTGEGPYGETIRKAGFDNVVMTGFKRGRELSRIYASCDCFAFPSGTETFGNTCLEAMASGLAVAGVGSGGITDYLVHGKNALLSANGDNDGFAGNLVELMTNREMRLRLAKNGIASAQARDWNRVFDGLLGEYETLIRRKTMETQGRAS